MTATENLSRFAGEVEDARAPRVRVPRRHTANSPCGTLQDRDDPRHYHPPLRSDLSRAAGEI
jgi:hypothetical protein